MLVTVTRWIASLEEWEAAGKPSYVWTVSTSSTSEHRLSQTESKTGSNYYYKAYLMLILSNILDKQCQAVMGIF